MSARPDYQPFFDRFVSEVLPLDAARVARIESATRHLERVVAGDIAFLRYRPKIIAQGSFATGTSVRPIRSTDEFDVDLVLELTLPPALSSSDALNWLRGRLARDATFKSRLTAHPRCVRVDYAGDFHLDVVPARRTSARSPITGRPMLRRLKVPDRRGGWRFSNPQGFVRWCLAQDDRTGGDFGRVVMMLKRWRDENAPEKRRIRSIVLTTLIGKTIASWPRGGTSTRPDADVLTATLTQLAKRLGPYTGVPIVKNPSLVAENLARTWSRAEFVAFRSEVREAAKLAVYARKARDPGAWRLLLGRSFPAV